MYQNRPTVKHSGHRLIYYTFLEKYRNFHRFINNYACIIVMTYEHNKSKYLLLFLDAEQSDE